MAGNRRGGRLPWKVPLTTFDNDTAFARHALLRQALEMATYFCDVYASWQKGAVENINGRLRRDLPRKIDIDKISLFEPHSDIIVKGGRQVHYGLKLNLTSGRSGMILDVVIEAGNPQPSVPQYRFASSCAFP